MRISKNLIFLSLLLFPSAIQADIPIIHISPQKIEIIGYELHFLNTQNVWKKRMGPFSKKELDDFVKATWKGTNENPELCETLAAISILECGPKISVRNRTGHLGGHVHTISSGLRLLKYRKRFIYWNCQKTSPYIRELALSRRFTFLYRHYHNNLEKTCRIWNQGNKYKDQKAKHYWNGVESFSKLYDHAVK